MPAATTPAKQTSRHGFRVTASSFCVFDGRSDLARISVVFSDRDTAQSTAARWAALHGYPFEVSTINPGMG